MRIQTQAGHLNDAIRAINQLIALESTDPLPYALRGKAAFLSGRDRLAVASYDRYRELA
jgi:hypothetical protein